MVEVMALGDEEDGNSPCPPLECLLTSRENLIPGAPKMLIPGEFGFASDLHAGGNGLSLANLLYALVIQKLSLANLL
jgi:hypothetical protein